MIRELTKAVVDMEDFHLVFQPQYNIKQHKIIGVEALIRWKHPQWGWVRPDLFIPVAEQAGLIGQIGQWVFREAAIQAVHWHEADIPLRLSVNLSPEQLKEEAIIELIEMILENTRLNPALLTLELTEGAPLYEAPSAIGRLHCLRELGCSIAIDDFGTGYSSLKYLMDIPVHFVKLDRLFISQLQENQRSRPIVQAMIELSRSLEFQIIAEGVECGAELQQLAGMGCHEIQGFFISPPVQAMYIPDLVAEFADPGRIARKLMEEV